MDQLWGTAMGTLADLPKCVCDPEFKFGHRFSPFIGENFKICAYTSRDIIGFCAGLINILIWLFAQSPQLYETYKNKSGGELSWSFLIIWLIGDVANLLGSLFTSQKLLLYTAVYFIIMDGLVLTQIIYYTTCYKTKKEKEKAEHDAAIADADQANEKSPLSPSSPHQYGTNSNETTTTTTTGTSSPTRGGGSRTPLGTAQNVVLISIALLALSSFDIMEAAPLVAIRNQLTTLASNLGDTILAVLQDPPKIPICDAPTSNSKVVKTIGVVCAWLCGLLYLTARIPQAVKIYKTKNVYGISFALFAMSFAANCFYALQILLPNTTDFHSISFWRDTFPYLVGSLGANVFSFIIMVQFFMYPAIAPEDEDKKAEATSEHHFNDEIDCHDVHPSHDYSKCPPHHNHDSGTGHVGELVLEISPTSSQDKAKKAKTPQKMVDFAPESSIQ